MPGMSKGLQANNPTIVSAFDPRSAPIVRSLQHGHRVRRRRFRGAGGVLAAAVLVGVGTAGCGGSSATARPVAASAAVGPTLATSIETSAGSWAAVPMGNLDQPLNTFWQLFFRPRGATRWTDEDTALAVATNGGLVLATPSGRSLAVGVRPANLLAFSPLVITSNGGRSWSPAPPVAALADQPDALAIGTGGRALALTTAATGDGVLESSPEIAHWHGLTTVRELESLPAGRACGIVSLTAVAVVAASSVIGADCRRSGVTGIFSNTEGGWHLAGPTVASSLEGGSVAVLSLQPTSVGLSALLEVSEGHDTRLVAAWTPNGGVTWSESPALQLGSGQVRSLGPDGGTGLFVLTSGTTAADSVEVLSGPGAAWGRLPSPPASTATLVFGLGGRVDALAVNDTVFTDWVLAARSGTWARAQVMTVPIEFGSSS